MALGQNRMVSVLGYGLSVLLRLLLWRHTLPHAGFFGLWCVLLPSWSENQNSGELRLWVMVRICTGLGTMAVLVGSVVVVVILRNYLGVVIGTWHILADLYWLVCDDI